MALTPRRWLVVAVLACAAIAVWQLPAGRSAPFPGPAVAGRFIPFYGYVRRYGWPDATARLGQATLHLRLLELRDSVFTPRVLAEPNPGLQVIVDRQFPDSIRLAMTRVLEAAWGAYHPGNRHPTIVALIQDTTTKFEGLPMGRTHYVGAEVFPPDTTTSACRVVARVRVALGRARANDAVSYTRSMVMQQLVTPYTGRTILGPCAMYATFGRPGPGIAHWLVQTGWNAAQAVDWNRDSPVWHDDYYVRYGSRRSLLDLVGLQSPAWDMRSRLSDDGIACVGGDDARCVSGLMQPAFAMAQDRSWRANVIDVGWWYSGQMMSMPGLGPTTGWILSDMVRDLGRQRFHVFWTSTGTPAEAFARATEEPLGVWLRRWAQRTYGSDVLGPTTPERGRLAGLVVLVGGLIVAMVFATERRVT